METTRPALDDIRSVTVKLLAYCRASEWAGYDPYDALNSRLFEIFPFLNSRVPRLVLTQALKRSPVNMRPWLLIPQTQNAKAIALFLSACLRLARLGLADGRLAQVMVDRLVALRSPGVPYWCWGYSFPWQTRTIIVPRGAPNLVCTTFVAGALLDVYEHTRDSRILSIVASAADYIVDGLYWEDASGCGFSYPLPALRSEIHNANFLAAALLCRIHRHTGQDRLLSPAITAARYSASLQHKDGSWFYGEAPSQRWIDNFHTGYNLCALRSISRDAHTSEFEVNIRHGLGFYCTHFVRADGAARYFHNRTFPVDIHCVAQSIITLLAFTDRDPSNVERALLVLRWALDHMWDERGFFYYRVLRPITIRTSYMRWSQAWMLLALSAFLSELTVVMHSSPTDHLVTTAEA